MLQSPLSILLAVLIACQMSLAGLGVCSDGGSCHAEGTPAHADHDWLADGHDHPAFVNVGQPHSCECTDQAIEGDDVTRGRRVGLPTAAVTLHFVGHPPPVPHPVTPAPRFVRAGPQGDAAGLQRIAIVRATRLLL